MTRPYRIEYKDAYYHVMNRGKGRQTIFHSNAYFDAFLVCLEQAHSRFGIEIQAYCLMSNHYHLLIKTPRANLSRAMRHINGVYTQKYNQLKKTDGPLFRGRYKAINIDAANYLLEVSRYIHRNPVETKKPLVADLVDYPWSSYPAYINKIAAPAWLYRQDVYGELGSQRPAQSYKVFVGKGLDEDTRQYYAKDIWPALRGDKAFRAKADTHALNNGKDVTRRRDHAIHSISTILKAVAKYFDVNKRAITHAKRGKGPKNLPRWIAMKLCQEYSGTTLVEIAGHFNVQTYGTVSITIARLNRLMQEDAQVRKDYYRISIDLTP